MHRIVSGEAGGLVRCIIVAVRCEADMRKALKPAPVDSGPVSYYSSEYNGLSGYNGLGALVAYGEMRNAVAMPACQVRSP